MHPICHLIPVLLLSTSLAAIAEEPTKLYPRLVQSTAWVRTTQQGVGTGWVVDKSRRWLVTNLHVVGDQDRVEAFFVVEQNEDCPFITQRQYYLENQKRLHEEDRAVSGKVILRREKSDLALIELERIPDGVPALPLAIEPPQPGEKVLSVGHRHDSEALWALTVGELRQKGHLTEGYFWRSKRLAENAPCWIVQSPILGGDSGSALVNRQGEVVGVLSGVRWQAPSASIAIQLSEVFALLAEARKQPTPKETSSSTNKDSIYPKLVRATGWVRPTSTDSRTAGWIVDRQRRLFLTTSQGAGDFDLVDVIFPVREHDNLVTETSAYRDLIGLRQSGQLVRGVVLARDAQRDLALIELEQVPADVGELSFASKEPLPGEAVQTVNHPLGVELLWLHASGTVRQAAKVEIVGTTMPNPTTFRALLLQIPTQAGSSGAAVANAKGEVVGLLTRKEGPQQQLGYALTSTELQLFIESARPLWKPTKVEEVRARSKWLRSRGEITLAFATWKDWTKSAAVPADLENLVEQVRLLTDRGELKLALKQIETYEAAFPTTSSPIYLIQKAELLSNLDRKEEALRICNSLLKNDNKCAGAYYVRGMCRAGDEAIADIEESLWIDPKLVKAYFRLGQLHEAAGNDDKALTDYGQAIELDPYRAEPIRRRAALYLRKKEPKRAIADYERLIELLPKDADAYRLLAVAYLAKGEEDKALVPLCSALRWDEKIVPGVLTEVLKHGEMLRQQWPDDPGKAGKWIADALKLIGSTINNMAILKNLDEVLKEKDFGKQLERLRLIVVKR